LASSAETPFGSNSERHIPKVGFVSLGCPKALTDSELILTQLSAEGYQTSKTFQGADLVIVNTCGFIDDAVKESLDTIGEALAENGKCHRHGLPGCQVLWDGGNLVRRCIPSVLAVTGPHATQEVMDAVHSNLPKPHDPFVIWFPTPLAWRVSSSRPRHYAYLKISEGCNHRCTFCIIPSMRGDLVSRPIGDVLNEARALFEGGVKELLVISQDTSAYGVDVKYRTGFWDGKPVKTRMLELVQALGEMAEPYGAWVRLHYVYPYPSVDDIIPLMATGKVLPYLDVPLQHSHPDVLARMKRPASGEKIWSALQRGAGLSGDCDSQHLHCRVFLAKPKRSFRTCWISCEAQIDRAGCFAYSAGEWCCCQRSAGHVASEARRAPRPFHGGGRRGVSAKLQHALDRHAGVGGLCAWSGQKRVVLAGVMPMRRRSMAWCVACRPKNQQDPEGGRIHQGAHRGHAGHDLVAQPI
jgi:ribosomal protein S12 methylthiotransferase